MKFLKNISFSLFKKTKYNKNKQGLAAFFNMDNILTLEYMYLFSTPHVRESHRGQKLQ